MNNNPQQDPLHRLELIISHMLRVGVLISGAFLFVGWIWLWIKNGDALESFHDYHPQALSQTVKLAFQNHDYPTLMAVTGLVVLILLPLSRVLMTGVLFVKQKDYMLSVIAFIVFATLIASFFLGIDL